MIGFVKTSLQSIKDLCQLDFFTKSLTFCFVLIYWLCWAESTASTAALQQKRSDILVVLWQKCQIFKVNYLWLKKFDTKINAILLISELMASVRKVLRHFHRHGEIFTKGCHMRQTQVYSTKFLFYNFMRWEPSINKLHFFKGGGGVTNWGRIDNVNYGRVLFHLDDLCWTVLHIVWSWFYEFLCRFPIWILNGRC